ncbi:hypothetical protein GCM10027284_22330 [Cyclobacterium sediminis]
MLNLTGKTIEKGGCIIDVYAIPWINMCIFGNYSLFRKLYKYYDNQKTCCYYNN